MDDPGVFVNWSGSWGLRRASIVKGGSWVEGERGEMKGRKWTREGVVEYHGRPWSVEVLGDTDNQKDHTRG